MWRAPRISYLVSSSSFCLSRSSINIVGAMFPQEKLILLSVFQVTRLSKVNVSDISRCYSQTLSQPSFSQTKSESIPCDQKANGREIPKHYIGENVSRKDRTKFLLTTVSIFLMIIMCC